MKRNKIFAKAFILSILYIIFITLFALDVKIFSISFLIHLLPTIIFTSCLIVSYYWTKIGALCFVIAGLGTIIVFNTYREIITLLTVSFIPIIIGVLFFISKKK